MNPLYCPFCGRIYDAALPLRNGFWYHCMCGGSWKTEYQDEREVPVETYPPTNLLSRRDDE